MARCLVHRVGIVLWRKVNLGDPTQQLSGIAQIAGSRIGLALKHAGFTKIRVTGE
jgi:hypothetical protein